MPTTNQLVRKGRRAKKRPPNARALAGHPQLRATVIRTFVIKPKKPNSAHRKCVRVRLSNGMEVTAYVPGKGLNLQDHSTCLVRGGRSPDLPGVKYRVTMGSLDAGGAQPEEGGVPRNQARSVYGVKRARGKK